MLRPGGFMLALFQRPQIRLKQQLIENQPENDKQDDLINYAVIKMNHGSTTAYKHALTRVPLHPQWRNPVPN
jgi:hypothetical protein